MSARDERIGPTAYYTSYVWHRLGMPYADLFATRRGAALFWSFRLSGEWIATATPRLPSMTQYLEIRHRLIEHRLGELEPDRIVEIGSGLSRRGITWAADHGVDYLEIDLPHMIAEKKRRIAERAPLALQGRLDGRLRFAEHDVLDPHFADFLAAQLEGASHPVVIAEGLLGYFPLDERTRIASSVREALARAGGGSFLCDLRAREGGATVAAAATVLRAGIRLVTRGRGARADFASIEAVRAFFRDAGFGSAEPVDQALLPALSHVTSPGRIWHAEVAGASPPQSHPR